MMDKILREAIRVAKLAGLIATEAGATVGHYSLEYNSNLPNCLNCNKVIVSSPGVFQELKAILTAVI